MSYKESFWDGCYDQGWQGLIHPAAFGHPAKYSLSLITRIISHALDSGYIQRGAVVVDPFGGQAGGGLPCMENGLHYVGVELEPKFIEVGQGSDCTGISKENWIRFYGRWDKGSFPIPEPETLKAAAITHPSNPLEASSIKDRPHFCPDCIAEAGRVIGETEDRPRSQAQAHRRKRIAFLAKKHNRPLRLYPASPLPGTQAEMQQAFAVAESGGSYRRNSGHIPSTGAHRFKGNIERWEEMFPHLPGSAILLQGDSRFLASVIAAAGCVVGSPPYAEAMGNGGAVTERDVEKGLRLRKENYGSTSGQLAILPPGSVDAVIASPSWAGNSGGRGEASRQGIDAALFDRHQGGMKKGTGDDPANLDHLPMGEPPLVIMGSPPHASGEKGHPSLGSVSKDDWGNDGRDIAGRRGLNGNYGSSSGQMAELPEGNISAVIGSSPFANTTGETFWQAAHTIMRQVNQILPEGGVAIWVTKGYIKSGKLVDFSSQWQALCVSCGFETVEVIRAWLVKRNGAQAGFDGEMVSKDVARKSFFRILAEKKGAPPIDYETVLITRKRAALTDRAGPGI